MHTGTSSAAVPQARSARDVRGPGRERLPGEDEPWSLLLADAEPIVARAVAAVLESSGRIRVVATASTVDDAIACWELVRPALTLIDLRLGQGSGYDLLCAIRARDPRARVLVLTSAAGEADVHRCVRAGAAGIVLKSGDWRDLWIALDAAMNGQCYLSGEASARLARSMGAELLTAREGETLRLLGEGLCNKEIARRLGIGEGTVKTYLKAILQKLGARSRTEALTIAVRRGLVVL